jgi:hypothetical protein
MRRLRLMALLAVVVSTLACGDKDPFTASDATAGLAPLVAKVRTAAEAHDPTAANHALDELRASVESLVAEDRIGGEEADRLLAAAAQVEDRLVLIAPATTVAPAPTTAAPPPPEAAEEPKKKKGRDNDDDD